MEFKCKFFTVENELDICRVPQNKDKQAVILEGLFEHLLKSLKDAGFDEAFINPAHDEIIGMFDRIAEEERFIDINKSIAEAQNYLDGIPNSIRRQVIANRIETMLELGYGTLSKA